MPRRSTSRQDATSLKFAQGHGRRESAGARARQDLRRSQRQAPRHRARSSTPTTATSSRPGASTSAPAAATCRARPCSCSRSRSKPPAACGSRSSSRRITAAGTATTTRTTTSAASASRSPPPTTPVADPLPADVRAILAVPAAERTPEQVDAACSATGGRPCPSGRKKTAASRRCGRAIRAARRSSCCMERDKPRPTHRLDRGNFLAPAEEVTPGVPAFLHPLDRQARRPESHAHPARLRPLARRSPFADHGPLDRQPHLAGVLRHRPGGDGRGPRHAGRAAVASGAARLAGRRADGQRLEPQAHPPADRHLGDVSAVERRDAGAAGARSGEPAAGPRPAVPRRRRSRPRHRARGQRPVEPKDRRAERLPAGAGVPVPAAGQLRAENRGSSTRARPLSPRRCTRSASARCPTRRCRTSTRPNGDFACARRVRSNTPLQALTTLNEPLFLECARATALRGSSPTAAQATPSG